MPSVQPYHSWDREPRLGLWTVAGLADHTFQSYEPSLLIPSPQQLKDKYDGREGAAGGGGSSIRSALGEEGRRRAGSNVGQQGRVLRAFPTLHPKGTYELLGDKPWLSTCCRFPGFALRNHRTLYRQLPLPIHSERLEGSWSGVH